MTKKMNRRYERYEKDKRMDDNLHYEIIDW